MVYNGIPNIIVILEKEGWLNLYYIFPSKEKKAVLGMKTL